MRRKRRHHGTEAHELSVTCDDSSKTWGNISTQLLHQWAPGGHSYGSTLKGFMLFMLHPWPSQWHELCYVCPRSLQLIPTIPKKMQLIFLSGSHRIFIHPSYYTLKCNCWFSCLSPHLSYSLSGISRCLINVFRLKTGLFCQIPMCSWPSPLTWHWTPSPCWPDSQACPRPAFSWA